jgi:hypothetical protein
MKAGLESLENGRRDPLRTFSRQLIDGGKVVSLMHPPHFTPQKHDYFYVSGIHFC